MPDIHLAPFPHAYRDFDGDEEAASAHCLGYLEDSSHEQLPPSSVAAFIIEPVQGEGGYVPAPASFLQGLRELADRHGILLILDEVQSGYGRSGKMWAFEHAGIVPDVVLAAKAIANGMPLAAIVSLARVAGALGRRGPRLDLRRQPRRRALRVSRCSRPSATRAWSPTQPHVARS